MSFTEYMPDNDGQNAKNPDVPVIIYFKSALVAPFEHENFCKETHRLYNGKVRILYYEHPATSNGDPVKLSREQKGKMLAGEILRLTGGNPHKILVGYSSGMNDVYETAAVLESLNEINELGINVVAVDIDEGSRKTQRNYASKSQFAYRFMLEMHKAVMAIVKTAGLIPTKEKSPIMNNDLEGPPEKLSNREQLSKTGLNEIAAQLSRVGLAVSPELSNKIRDMCLGTFKVISYFNAVIELATNLQNIAPQSKKTLLWHLRLVQQLTLSSLETEAVNPKKIQEIGLIVTKETAAKHDYDENNLEQCTLGLEEYAHTVTVLNNASPNSVADMGHLDLVLKRENAAVIAKLTYDYVQPLLSKREVKIQTADGACVKLTVDDPKLLNDPQELQQAWCSFLVEYRAKRATHSAEATQASSPPEETKLRFPAQLIADDSAKPSLTMGRSY